MTPFNQASAEEQERQMQEAYRRLDRDTKAMQQRRAEQQAREER